MKPILTRSEITGAVYIATRYRILEDGSVDATEKYDVTDQFDAMTEPLRAENAKLRKFAKIDTEDIDTMSCLVDDLRAENAKLRMCLGEGCADCAVGMGEYADSLCDPLKAENEKLKKRLAQYELFREVVGDPVLEFASLRRKIHRAERENAKLVKRNEELQADVIRLFLSEVRRWIDCKQHEMEDGQ